MIVVVVRSDTGASDKVIVVVMVVPIIARWHMCMERIDDVVSSDNL